MRKGSIPARRHDPVRRFLMPDDFTPELTELIRQASQEGDEEKLLMLTKRTNELLRHQAQQRRSSQSDDAD
jgi:hypothetical protein